MPKNNSIKPAASKPADPAVSNLLVAANDTTAPKTPVVDTNEISHEEAVQKTAEELAAEAAAADAEAAAKKKADRLAALGKETFDALVGADPAMRKAIIELSLAVIKANKISEEVDALVRYPDFKTWITNTFAAYAPKRIKDRVQANLLLGDNLSGIADGLTVLQVAFPDVFKDSGVVIPAASGAKGLAGALVRLRAAAKPRLAAHAKFKKELLEGKRPDAPVFPKPRVELAEMGKIDVVAEMQAEATLGQELFADYKAPELTVKVRKELILLMRSEVSDGVVSTDTRALVRTPGFMELLEQQIKDRTPFGQRVEAPYLSAPLVFYTAFPNLVPSGGAGIVIRLKMAQAAQSAVTPPESAPTIPANTALALNPDAPAVGG